MVLSAIPAGVPAQVDEARFAELVHVGAHDDPIHPTDALSDSDPEKRADQRITFTFCWSKKSVVMRAVCGRALSCWNISRLTFITSNKCGLRISSRYRTAF